ncbi:MAG: hypothetical protein CM15mP74_19730 [Halieaceae bacterium]|nr:MAG: hypothetical protein CM15mP74_19730 [Halieaceae bacterium]
MIELADHVGSTTQIIRAAKEMPQQTFIVATDQGIFYKLQQAAPDKQFIIAPTAGQGATCRSCANCPWMAMNDLEAMAAVFDQPDNEVHIAPDLAQRAMRPLERMLAFAETLNPNLGPTRPACLDVTNRSLISDEVAKSFPQSSAHKRAVAPLNRAHSPG